jgi:uncharacterized membrane protein YkvA (DUF1232 family)
MSEKRRSIEKLSERGGLPGWWDDAVRQVKLAWHLFLDERVSLWAKLVPPLSLAYVLFPIDILPDVVLGLGQLDDLAIVLLGLKLFVELAPPEVVQEHLQSLGAQIEEWRVVDRDDQSGVVDGNYVVKLQRDDTSQASQPRQVDGSVRKEESE